MSMPSSPTPPNNNWQSVWNTIVRDVGTIPAVVSLITAHPKTFGSIYIGGVLMGFAIGKAF